MTGVGSFTHWDPTHLQQLPALHEEDGDRSDFSDDEDDLYPGLTAALGGVRNGTTKYLNYTIDYVWSWGCAEAFRESYQNWRDGILRSFNLSLSQFTTRYTEKGRLILITVRHPTTEKPLGFIRFLHDKDGFSVGGLKLANFNATLAFGALGTGATSKAGDAGQTGQHGEGLKLSALVYRRSNYNFRIESGGFKWNFLFKKGELACRLARINIATAEKIKAKAAGQPRTDISHPWEDVCVVIGAPGSARTSRGDKTKGKTIHVDDFRKWLKVTLDINPPEKLIRTPHGDLIRHAGYQAHMYLHGLILPSGGICGDEYSYGYNFVSGRTTRDRDSLAGSGEESRKIASIWAAAIQADDSEDSDITAEYTYLLLNSLNTKGDAMLSEHKNCLTKDIATRVWQKMLVMNKDVKGRLAFYYSAIEGKDEVQIIEQSLKKNPVPLDQQLWNMLTKYHLCRTPGEELLHRFRFAKVVDVPNETFATHMNRMLWHLLQISEVTRDMRLTFVDGKFLKVDAGFFADTWRIHDKWLTHEGSHENTFCDERNSEDDGFFSCDHVVLHLWDIILSQLMVTGKYPRITASEGWLKSKARSYLSQTPRAVECTATEKKGQIRVTWKSVDSHQHKDSDVVVVLHAQECSGEAGNPQMGLQFMTENEHPCHCPSQLSTAVSNGVTFSDLDPSQSYCPSVSRNVEGAFIALLPDPVTSRDQDFATTPEPNADNTDADGTDPDDSPVGLGDSFTNLSDEEDRNTYRVQGNSYRNHPCSPRTTRGLRRSASSSQAPPTLDNSERVPDDSDNVRSPSVMHESDDGAHNSGSRTSSEDTSSSKGLGQFGQSDNDTSRAEGESHVLGARVEHQSLDWGGSFPGSHDFYRTRDRSREDIFIVKPKTQWLNENGKRMRQLDGPSRCLRFNLSHPGHEVVFGNNNNIHGDLDHLWEVDTEQ